MIVELRTDYFLFLWFWLCNIVMSLCIYKCMHFSHFLCACMYEILTLSDCTATRLNVNVNTKWPCYQIDFTCSQ